MSGRVVLSVEYCEKDQPSGSNDGENDCANTEKCFLLVVVGSQSASVSKPSLGDERQVEDHHHRRAAGDKQRFEKRCADV